MLFNSFEFLFFFPIVTVLYFLLPQSFRAGWLLFASCVFYMAFIPAYILILAATILIDYSAGRFIERATGRRRKYFLVLSLVTNVGVLAVFKYYHFFIENLQTIFSHLGTEVDFPVLSMILPIGLSFHTFQAMSYTIEVYRGRQTCEKSLLQFALYVMFYPQLVAGPIERPQNLLHQFKEKHSFDYTRVVDGLRLMLWGLVKKVVIADRLAVIVNQAYSNVEGIHGLPLLLVLYFFSIQIYCDFSGYSDIAVGSAKVMGFQLMRNFDMPYLASSLGDFWKRWHISLSTWFRDYLYYPMGGNRVPWRRWVLNTMVVFIVSGFWHGASWTFVLWGVLHGLGLVISRYGGKVAANWSGPLRTFLTFQFVTLTWVFFRAPSIDVAFSVFKQLTHWQDTFTIKQFGVFGLGYFEVLWASLLVAALMVVELWQRRSQFRFDMAFAPMRWATYYAALALLILFGKFSQTQFIYFQF